MLVEQGSPGLLTTSSLTIATLCLVELLSIPTQVADLPSSLARTLKMAKPMGIEKLNLHPTLHERIDAYSKVEEKKAMVEKQEEKEEKKEKRRRAAGEAGGEERENEDNTKDEKEEENKDKKEDKMESTKRKA